MKNPQWNLLVLLVAITFVFSGCTQVTPEEDMSEEAIIEESEVVEDDVPTSSGTKPEVEDDVPTSSGTKPEVEDDVPTSSGTKPEVEDDVPTSSGTKPE